MEKSHEYFFLIFIVLIGVFFYIFIAYFEPQVGKAMVSETYARIDPGIRVLYYTFNGSTTQFLYYNDAELGAIENTTLERTAHGKIIFDGLIDLASDAVDNVVDLDSNVNISENWIQLNASRLNSLSGSAILYLYNLNFVNPRILVGGNACPASRCQILSYYYGVLKFSVAYFTEDGYSVDENPPPPPVEPVPKGGGGGGGGGNAPTKPMNMTKKILLELDADISQTVFAGEEKNVLIKLKNKGDLELLNTALFATTNAPDIGLSLTNDFFERLDPGQEDSLILKIKSLAEPIAHIGIENYIVTVTADVGNYEYTAYIRFFINVREKDYELRLNTEKQLNFADEFFAAAKDCSEFAGQIKEAWEQYDISQYNVSLSLIDAAMQKCRDTKGVQKGEEEAYIEKAAPGKVNVLLLSIEIFVLLILIIAMLAYFRWKKSKEASKPEELPEYFKATPEQKEKSNLHREFNSIFDKTWQSVRNNDVINSRKGYTKLYSLYQSMRSAEVDDFIKVDCYKKLAALYTEINRMGK
jgi:hypothetical protein